MVSPREEEESKFIQESAKFMKQFDSHAEDLFRGPELERLALDFIEKHARFLSDFPFPLSDVDLQRDSAFELVKDDFRILNLDCSPEEGQAKEKAKMNKTLAGIYWRASEASYLRVTFNKSRLDQEDDRQAPVDWARKAIRYDANSFEVAYWFMIGKYCASFGERARRCRSSKH